MDTPTRIKTKIGEHEFEAEGSVEYVREQFQAWQELVKLAVSAPHQPLRTPTETIPQSPTQPRDAGQELDLSKILRTEGRYVSLTARASNVDDAVLIMLYGQKSMRNNDAVTGAEILQGIANTGGFGAVRLKRILDKLASGGEVMSFGERRGKKYRLTNTGIAKARTLAMELIATVA